jgi:hypothetical protein
MDTIEIPKTANEQPPQAHFFIKLLVLSFVLTYLTAALGLVIDCWIHNSTIRHSYVGT